MSDFMRPTIARTQAMNIDDWSIPKSHRSASRHTMSLLPAMIFGSRQAAGMYRRNSLLTSGNARYFVMGCRRWANRAGVSAAAWTALVAALGARIGDSAKPLPDQRRGS